MTDSKNVSRAVVRERAQTAQDSATEIANSVAALRTEVDRAHGFFGFGRRIFVPADEIHVAVGVGRHALQSTTKSEVFGQTDNRASRYWLNSATQVIKLKTISFTVPIRGFNNEGVEALDDNKVSFRLWAHAVAKLNPEKAEIAAQRVGLDTVGLVNTITKVGEAELIGAAATMSLQDIIAKRQELSRMAFSKVNQVLSELGYDLALLTITKLDGEAYRKLVQQSEAHISAETTAATNRAQLAEMEDNEARKQREAVTKIKTQKSLSDAARQAQTEDKIRKEQLAVQDHEMLLQAMARDEIERVREEALNQKKLELSQAAGISKAEKEAELAKLAAERRAEVRRLQQKREAEVKLKEAEAQLKLKEAEAEIKLKAAEADANRLALEQLRQIERSAELTQAEANRLQREERARAQRAKEVALIEASQLAESLSLEAEAEANALTLRTNAQANAELTKAEAEASAAEKLASAAKIRADATRAETAAPGLAKAEVEEARLTIAEMQVAIRRAEGLAAAEIAQAQAAAEAEKLQRIKDVDINAQKALASLYEETPVLVDLEKMRLELAHKERIAQLENETHVKVFEAIAPSMKIHVIGNSGQMGQMMSNVMTFSHGMTTLGEEVPAIGNLLGNSPSGEGVMQHLSSVVPHLRTMLSEVNPRMLASLTVNDVVDRLGDLQGGDATLVEVISGIKQDANMRMIGDLPVQPFLKMLGIGTEMISAEMPEAIS